MKKYQKPEKQLEECWLKHGVVVFMDDVPVHGCDFCMWHKVF